MDVCHLESILSGEKMSNVKTNIVDENKTQVCLVFKNSSENLARYADIINYTYCEEKRRTSAPIIEHLKIKEFNYFSLM